MEQKFIKCLILKNYSDELGKYVFLKILTEESVEIIKLSKSLESKSKNLFHPDKIYTLELIKTRKNWILKSILQFEQWCFPSKFQDFLLLAQIISSVDSSLKVGELTNALNFTKNYFNLVGIDKCNLQDFNEKLQIQLGYNSISIVKS
jgi:hypothetical protein